MTHPLVVALFADPAVAARAASELRGLGVPRERVSIVSSNHEEEGALADASGGSPGSEIEDSRVASRLGELSAHLLAAIAIGLPGIGPIVADGPLAAGLGEAAGHLAGGVAPALERMGFSNEEAEAWEGRIKDGAVLIGAHVTDPEVTRISESLHGCGAERVVTTTWVD